MKAACSARAALIASVSMKTPGLAPVGSTGVASAAAAGGPLRAARTVCWPGSLSFLDSQGRGGARITTCSLAWHLQRSQNSASMSFHPQMTFSGVDDEPGRWKTKPGHTSAPSRCAPRM